MLLRNNQQKAINTSLNNDFSNGVHFHATGTGKSIIILELIKQYNLKYPKNNILWLCETKSILSEQFAKIKTSGYDELLKKFDILRYYDDKQKDWYESVNTNSFWSNYLINPKPYLLIINRAFLTNKMNYKKITNKINFIVHDECHTIINKTTQQFYRYILKKDNPKCIGLSATPYTEIMPYKNILTNYTIYQSCSDEIILPPNIYWLSCENSLKPIEYLNILENYIFCQLPYKKILVWVGIIEKCNELADIWQNHLSHYKIFIDTSINPDGYDKFKNINTNSILFCAGKHREGSDINNLDCCIFMDKVQNRSSKTFVQSLGRVLRRDKLNKKKQGIIVDFHAKNAITICERLNKYIEVPDGVNPWDFNHNNITINHKNITLSNLEFQTKSFRVNIKENLVNSDIRTYFKRDYEHNSLYEERINKELTILKSKNVIPYLFRALEILNLAGDIPHVTRGSCGSSLICYLLNISHVDPVEHNICFERFLNKYRKSLPDIDFDFPYNKRDDIFLKIYQKWPDRIARISNHVFYHEKSASREALRRIGHKGMIPKLGLNRIVNNLHEIKKKDYYKIKSKLLDTLKNYSLHCGGIIYYENGIPPELILKKSLLSQIILNKKDVSTSKLFKIDILSSRALSQLNYIYNGQPIDFEKCKDCPRTYELLSNGDNIGLILAESPLIRKAFLTIQPKNISDIALSLAVVRPAANLEEGIIYDDDIIELIHTEFKCDHALADKYRKELLKDNEYIIEECRIKYKMTDEFLEKVQQFKKYSFCKSHAMSYAQLIFKLAYGKTHYPKRFWKSTLKHCVSNYQKWVYPYEASKWNISYKKNDKHTSVYCKNKNIDYIDDIISEVIPKCYIENIGDNKYQYHGLIANIKYNYKVIIIHIFVGNGYYTMTLDKKLFVDKKNEITGIVEIHDYKQFYNISCEFL